MIARIYEKERVTFDYDPSVPDEAMTDANGLITGYFNSMEAATTWIKQS